MQGQMHTPNSGRIILFPRLGPIYYTLCLNKPTKRENAKRGARAAKSQISQNHKNIKQLDTTLRGGKPFFG